MGLKPWQTSIQVITFFLCGSEALADLDTGNNLLCGSEALADLDTGNNLLCGSEALADLDTGNNLLCGSEALAAGMEYSYWYLYSYLLEYYLFSTQLYSVLSENYEYKYSYLLEY